VSKINLKGIIQEIVSASFSNILIISYSISDSLGRDIQKECGKIFPLDNVIIRKVKLLKKPKFDLTKLMELYQEKPE
jgi:small subunit ribosomal protein S3Ae